MKQTAVQWLIEQLECRLESLPEHKLVEQAKAMEEEIIESRIKTAKIELLEELQDSIFDIPEWNYHEVLDFKNRIDKLNK